MSVISELRALLAKATPGPWVGGFAGRADIVHYDGDDSHEGKVTHGN